MKVLFLQPDEGGTCPHLLIAKPPQALCYWRFDPQITTLIAWSCPKSFHALDFGDEPTTIVTMLTGPRFARAARISAPMAGFVHQLASHTVGGVITPAEPAMLIVPADDSLQVEARINPPDIDQAAVGQRAQVKLHAFNQCNTPELPIPAATADRRGFLHDQGCGGAGRAGRDRTVPGRRGHAVRCLHEDRGPLAARIHR